MATFKIAYTPDPPPTGIPDTARRYLDEELNKLQRIMQLVNGVLANHEQRLQDLEP